MNRFRRAALAVALALPGTLAITQAASGAPVGVHVRVEGIHETLFDRVVRTDGHAIRATSDTQDRRCDGTNNAQHAEPGATATGATVDAMATLGQTFDGDWYPGYDDYFITQIGPERQTSSRGWYWGILVNGTFTPVGGCQFQVKAGDEVLWVNDAFNGRPFLGLSGTADAVVGQAVSLAVRGTPASAANPGTPAPYAGATLSAVDANGQPAGDGILTATTSGADGFASVTFLEPGWQRVKARDVGTGVEPKAIASSGWDVCVRPTDQAPPCAGRPPSQVPPGTDEPTATSTPTPVPKVTSTPQPAPIQLPQAASVAPPSPPAVSQPAPQLTAPAFTNDGRPRGRVTVRWAVAQPGVGVRGWSLSSRLAADPEAPFVQRGSGAGTPAAGAALRLPAGRESLVRLTVTDALGRPASTDVGPVLVPLDDRSKAVRTGKGWSPANDAGAWAGTVSRGAEGARLRVALAAGTPVIVVRTQRRAARLKVTVGGLTQMLTLPAGKRAATRELALARAAKAGTMTATVVSGTAAIDGVAVR